MDIRILLTCAALILATLFACNRKSGETKSQEPPMHENCSLKPEPGPCRMAITRFYYDPAEKKCKQFTYGGCKGVVPFETLEACMKGCNCTD